MPRKPSVPSKSPARISAKKKIAQDICTLIAQEKLAHNTPEWASALGYIRSVIARTYRLSEEYGRVISPRPKTRKTPVKRIGGGAETEKPKKVAQRRKPPSRERDVECVDLLHRK